MRSQGDHAGGKLNRCGVPANPAELGTWSSSVAPPAPEEVPWPGSSGEVISIYPLVTPASGAGHITLGNIIHCQTSIISNRI